MTVRPFAVALAALVLGGRADAVPVRTVQHERLGGTFLKISGQGATLSQLTAARITLRLTDVESADDSTISGAGARSFRCRPAPSGTCPAASGKVGTLVIVQDDYPSSAVSFDVALDGGGSCAFTGRVPFFDTRPIPAMSGTYRCTDTAGAETDSGMFVLSGLDAAPARRGSAF